MPKNKSKSIHKKTSFTDPKSCAMAWIQAAPRSNWVVPYTNKLTNDTQTHCVKVDLYCQRIGRSDKTGQSPIAYLHILIRVKVWLQSLLSLQCFGILSHGSNIANRAVRLWTGTNSPVSFFGTYNGRSQPHCSIPQGQTTYTRPSQCSLCRTRDDRQ